MVGEALGASAVLLAGEACLSAAARGGKLNRWAGGPTAACPQFSKDRWKTLTSGNVISRTNRWVMKAPEPSTIKLPCSDPGELASTGGKSWKRR